MARIKFSTDSAADLPAQLRDELSIQVQQGAAAVARIDGGVGLDVG